MLSAPRLPPPALTVLLPSEDGRGGCEIWFCPRRRPPLLSSAPKVIRSSVEMAGITAEPSGRRATREKRKMAASRELKKVRAPAKKKLPGGRRG